MKKIYIQPQTAVVKTTPATIIASSDPVVGVNTSGSINAAELDTKYDDWNIWNE
ncbi:MAG: hypothetical protein IJ700_01795 [Bacteroidaceae bacterium]|nr:hypothetical protein [Bacteroidaceae bacterium]